MLFVVIGIIGFLISCKPIKAKRDSTLGKQPVSQTQPFEEPESKEKVEVEVERPEIDALSEAGESFYVVRTEAFFYTDEAFESLGAGLYDSLFTDRQKAKEYLLLRQKEIVKDFSLDDLFFYSDSTVLKKLHDYFEENFSINIQDQEYKNFYTLDRSVRFPEEASIKQIDEILKLGAIKVARIAAFNTKPTFYIASPNEVFWKMIGKKVEKWFYTTEYYGKRVYSDKEEAITEFNRLSSEQFFSAKIKGTLEELSDSPALLKALIENDQALNYNETTKEIALNSPNQESKIALLELLKIRPFVLEEISLQEFKKMSDQYRY